MSVYRRHKKTNYTCIDNHVFKDHSLSMKAKGLLTQIYSLPDDWEYSVKGLSTLFSDGRDAVNNALQELIDHGYIVRTQKQNQAGKFDGYEYDIYEQPQTESADKPFTENPLTDNPLSDNPNQLNTNIINTNKENTKENIYISANEDFFDSLPDKPKKKFIPPTLEEVTEYCNQRKNNVDPESFIAYYASQNWKKANGRPISDWKLCVITWEKKDARRHDPTKKSGNPFDELLSEEGYT